MTTISSVCRSLCATSLQLTCFIVVISSSLAGATQQDASEADAIYGQIFGGGAEQQELAQLTPEQTFGQLVRLRDLLQSAAQVAGGSPSVGYRLQLVEALIGAADDEQQAPCSQITFSRLHQLSQLSARPSANLINYLRHLKLRKFSNCREQLEDEFEGRLLKLDLGDRLMRELNLDQLIEWTEPEVSGKVAQWPQLADAVFRLLEARGADLRLVTADPQGRNYFMKSVYDPVMLKLCASIHTPAFDLYQYLMAAHDEPDLEDQIRLKHKKWIWRMQFCRENDLWKESIAEEFYKTLLLKLRQVN